MEEAAAVEAPPAYFAPSVPGELPVADAPAYNAEDKECTVCLEIIEKPAQVCTVASIVLLH